MKLIFRSFLGTIFPLIMLLIIIPLLQGCATTVSPAGSQIAAVSDDNGEYPELDQYGHWMDMPPYGEVWQPEVIDNWQPFTYGNWMWTNKGWAWVSYEPYGWLVFHYGFWDYQPDVGWFWIPGDQWSPARVEWIEYGDYVGWAPLPPSQVLWPRPWEPHRFHIWIIVERNRFLDDDIGRHRISRFPERRPEGGIIIDREPDVSRVEHWVNHPIPERRLERQRIRFRDHEYQRMEIPPEERPRIERRREETRREVLRPRPRPAPHERKHEEHQRESQRGKKSEEHHHEKHEKENHRND
jgi:hypothetical protein